MLDESAQTLFLTEMFRGLNYTLKSFFDPKVTVSMFSVRFCFCVSSNLLTRHESINRYPVDPITRQVVVAP